MINGGMPIAYVSDLDRSVTYYTETLGLKAVAVYPGHFAVIECGKGLTLGLHPASPQVPAPGTSGAITVCFNVDEPLDDVVATLTLRGVQFRGPVHDDPTSGMRFAFFGDPDGNDLWLSESPKSW